MVVVSDLEEVVIVRDWVQCEATFGRRVVLSRGEMVVCRS
jgi:hypothetical protein